MAPKVRIAWKQFGIDLRGVRVERGATLRKTADILGFSKSMLSRAENGRPITAAAFVWLADWAGKDARQYLAPLYTRSK